jgi:peptidoglycan/LPS O-acetylase OafA/YrhL
MAGLAASGSLLIFRWALRGRATRRPFALVLFISTAAYVMYLSHRPILLAATSLFFPAAPSAQLAWLVAICLPFIVVFSWALQQLYDAGLAMVIGRRVDAGSAPRLS